MDETQINYLGNYVVKERPSVDESELLFKDVKTLEDLPDTCDLREHMPKIVPRQENIGACVANLVAVNLEYLYQKHGREVFFPSRLYIYFIARVFYTKQLPENDSGTSIEDACKAITKWGACPEEMWPYQRSRFFMFPTSKCFEKGRSQRVFRYFMVSQRAEDICSVIEQGYPVLCSLQIYSSFYAEFTSHMGKVAIPDTIREIDLGGHSLLLVGYDLNKRVFVGMNSWGNSWGMDGYCEIDFDYILNEQLARDFFFISLKD